jgi:membrane associated rhomboid family serine protease
VIPIGDSPQRRSFPWVTLLLVLANVAVFAYELSLGSRQLDRFIASAGTTPVEILSGRDMAPPAPGSIYATLVTAMFIHGGFLHIGSNMLFLWVFGDNVEDAFGHARFMSFYLLSGILAGLTHVLFNTQSIVPTVGASGAVAGVLGAYLVLFPRAQVRTVLFLGVFFTITRVPALLLIGFWFLSQLFSGLMALEVQEAAGIAFWAHIGGFVAGFLLTGVFHREPPVRAPEPW